MNFSLAAQMEVLPMMKKVPVAQLLHLAEQRSLILQDKLELALDTRKFTWRKHLIYCEYDNELVVLSDGIDSEYAANYYSGPLGGMASEWKRESYLWEAPDEILEAFDIPDRAYLPRKMSGVDLKKLRRLILEAQWFVPYSKDAPPPPNTTYCGACHRIMKSGEYGGFFSIDGVHKWFCREHEPQETCKVCGGGADYLTTKADGTYDAICAFCKHKVKG